MPKKKNKKQKKSKIKKIIQEASALTNTAYQFIKVFCSRHKKEFSFVFLIGIGLTIFGILRSPTKEDLAGIERSVNHLGRELPEIIENRLWTTLDSFDTARDDIFRDIQKATGQNKLQIGEAIQLQIQEAVQALDSNRFEDAVTRYLSLIDFFPNVAEFHFSLALSYQELDMNEKAIAEYEEGLTLKSDNILALNNLANALGKTGDTDSAIAIYDSVISISPTYPFPYNNKANLLVDRGFVGEAIELYERAIDLNNFYFDARVNASIAYYISALGNDTLRGFLLDKALEHLMLAILISDINRSPALAASIDSQDLANVHFRIALINNKKGNLLEAISSCINAMKIDSMFMPAQIYYSDLLIKSGKTLEAKDQLIKAIQFDPANAYAHRKLGDLYYDLDDLESTISEYSAAARLDTLNSDYHHQLGLSLLLKGDLVDSEKEFMKAIKLKPDSWDSYLNVGSIFFKQKKFAEAERVLMRANEINPDNYFILQNLKKVRKARNVD